jgi:hypothetical protein
MRYNKSGYEFGSLVEKIAKKFNITNAIAWNLISGEDDPNIANLLDVVPAGINCIFADEPEAHSEIADKFGFDYSELDNLIKLYNKDKKGITVGLVLGYLIGQNETHKL